MKSIIIHSGAELELWQAVDYYESKCADLGLDLEHEVSRSLSRIQETPKRWPTKKFGTRRLYFKDFLMLFTI
jgi:hypothetical protein